MDNDQNYVTRDLWNESIKRIEQTVEANLAKHESIANKMLADLIDIRDEIKIINKRLSDMQCFLYWKIALFTVMLAIAAFLLRS